MDHPDSAAWLLGSVILGASARLDELAAELRLLSSDLRKLGDATRKKNSSQGTFEADFEAHLP